MRHSEQDAFSLVELSIVLVILGLLVGGIMTGQNLIRAAELRSVSSEGDTYRTAVNLFRDKYLALPGDMRNAHDFWDDGADGVCGTAAECNGDGDGELEDSDVNPQENYRFWQHLALAGLITGDYTGTGADGTVTGDCVAGVNVPKAKAGNGGYIVHNEPSVASMDTPAGASVILQLGAPPNTDLEDCHDAAILLQEEAWNLDTKIDDGQADQGNVHMQNGKNSTDCLVNQGTDNSFKLSADSTACRAIIKLF